MILIIVILSILLLNYYNKYRVQKELADFYEKRYKNGDVFKKKAVKRKFNYDIDIDLDVEHDPQLNQDKERNSEL